MTGFGPGSVLGGRYRIEVLLSEFDAAKFWLGVDTSLDRKVAIHTIPNTDARASRLVDAARASASVVEAHLLRVLDCTVEDDLTWVVNEWGEGSTLHDLLGNGPLPHQRASWLSLEVASAVAHAHRQGVAHGRLNPESVMVTRTGEVKLIGFVVNAALRSEDTQGSRYQNLSPLEADVIDLASIVYAAATARWPGYSPSAVEAPPFDQHGALRPRQVRAGVPRELDGLCVRVLREEGFDHALPIETAHEIHAALSDFVGIADQWAPATIAEVLTAPNEATLPHPRPSDSWLHSGLIPVIDAMLASEETLGNDPEPQPVEHSSSEPPVDVARSSQLDTAHDVAPGTDRWLFGDHPVTRTPLSAPERTAAPNAERGHQRSHHQERLLAALVIITVLFAMVIAFMLGLKG